MVKMMIMIFMIMIIMQIIRNRIFHLRVTVLTGEAVRYLGVQEVMNRLLPAISRHIQRILSVYQVIFGLRCLHLQKGSMTFRQLLFTTRLKVHLSQILHRLLFSLIAHLINFISGKKHILCFIGLDFWECVRGQQLGGTL